MMADPQLSPVSMVSPILQDSGLKQFACLGCTQRKVKCDKRQPCLACTKSRLECLYRATPPPQRQKRKFVASSQPSLDRLQSQENVARAPRTSYEAPIASDHTSGQRDQYAGSIATTTDNRVTSERGIEEARDRSPAASGEVPNHKVRTSFSGRGLLVSEHGGTRYYEHGLMGALGQEYRRDPVEIVEPLRQQSTAVPPQNTSSSIAATIMTGSRIPSASPLSSPPSSVTVMKYYSVFMDNVHPLTKIVHAPSIHRMIVESMAAPQKNTEALRNSIYACAVASMTEKSCYASFQESRKTLLHNLQTATRHALLDSEYPRVARDDPLRAHVLLLTSMLQNSDAASLWILLGSVIRMAQSQGVHRDGATIGLSPFETEMRRRLWWYIITLDARLSEVMGADSNLPRTTDALLPSNVDDSQLSSDMTSPPQERTGASEMIFCLAKYEITKFLLEQDRRRADYANPELQQANVPPTTRNTVAHLERLIEDRFLRFCDPIKPVHFLTNAVARSTICKFRQMAQHIRDRAQVGNPGTRSPDQGNTTLNIATQNIQYDNLIHSTKSLSGFFWHVDFYFPWGAPIFVLRRLASRTEWDIDMENAWDQIEALHTHHPEFTDTDKGIHLIVGDLTLKAWNAKVAALESMGNLRPQPSSVLAALQWKHTTLAAQHSDDRARSVWTPFEDTTLLSMDFAGAGSPTDFELLDPMFAGLDGTDYHVDW